jgi:Putative adhesin
MLTTRTRPAVLLLVLLGAGCVIDLSGSRPTLNGVTLAHSVERAEQHALELASEDVLWLVTREGRVEVTAGSGAPVLHAVLRAHGRTREEAAAVLERYRLVLVRRADGLHAELEGEPLRVADGSTRLELSAHVDLVASVPPGTHLEASSGSGELVTRGPLGRVALESGFGAIQVDEAHQGLRAKSGSGDVTVARLLGGEGELTSGFGRIRVHEARARELSCRSGSGDVVIDASAGAELELETGFGLVRVGSADGAVRARSGSGDVRLASVHGPVTAHSEFGTVEVEGTLSALEASSGSGDVRVTARPGSRVEPSWTASSGFGAILLLAPADLACRLDVRTSFGAIECAFPVTTEAGARHDGRRLAGTIGAGGGTVSLSSGSGDVVLRGP